MFGVPHASSRLFQYAEEGAAESLSELLAGGTVGSVRVCDSVGRSPINLAISAESLKTIQVSKGGRAGGREGSGLGARG